MKPIVGIERWGGELVPGFTFDAISLPAGESIDEGMWNCAFESLMVPATNGHLHIRVTADTDGGTVALATFGAGRDVVQCCGVNVDEGFRGRKIALSMYHFAACLFEAPVVPASTRSTLSEQFWKNRTSIAC